MLKGADCWAPVCVKPCGWLGGWLVGWLDSWRHCAGMRGAGKRFSVHIKQLCSFNVRWAEEHGRHVLPKWICIGWLDLRLFWLLGNFWNAALLWSNWVELLSIRLCRVYKTDYAALVLTIFRLYRNTYTPDGSVKSFFQLKWLLVSQMFQCSTTFVRCQNFMASMMTHFWIIVYFHKINLHTVEFVPFSAFFISLWLSCHLHLQNACTKKWK